MFVEKTYRPKFARQNSYFLALGGVTPHTPPEVTPLSLPATTAAPHDEVVTSIQAKQATGPDPALWIEVNSKMVISRSV